VRVPMPKPPPIIVLLPTPSKDKYNFDDEPINPGKSYRDYVETAKKRHPEEKWHNVPIGKNKCADILVDVWM